MSQKKVEEYKKSKSSRKADSKKERVVRYLELGIVAVLIVAGCIWFAVAGVTASHKGEVKTTVVNTEAVDLFLQALE